MADTVLFTATLAKDEAMERFSADEIQDALNRQAIELRYVELTALVTMSPGPVESYLDFQTPRDRKWIDGDFALYDSDYNAITPDSFDLEAGKFTFSAEPSYPIYIVGKSYDPYNAAADLMIEWASANAGNLQSFSTQNGTFTYASIADDYRNQGMQLRERGRKNVAV